MGASHSRDRACSEKEPILDRKEPYGIQGLVGEDGISSPKHTGSPGRKCAHSGPLVSITRIKKERLWAVATAVLIACLASLLGGMVLGYSSGTLLELGDVYKEQYPSTFGIKENSIYYSLFGSFAALGAIFGAPFASPLSDRLGRKPALMLGGLPAATGWLMITLAHLTSTHSGFLALLLLGRLFSGFSAGWFIFCVSIYISEISSATTKGIFGVCNPLFITTGVFMSLALGIISESDKFPSFHYYHVSLIALGMVALFEVLMIFTCETPRWLYAKGRELEGNRVLNLLRGPNADIPRETEAIKEALEKVENLSLQKIFQEFKKRSVYQPFILLLFLMFFQQFSGIDAAIFYAGSIFKQAKVSNAQFVSTFAVGGVQIFSTLVSIAFVDHIGRKLLLLLSSVGICLSSLVLGVHFLIMDTICGGCTGNGCSSPPHPICEHDLGPLAITSVIVFVFSFNFAWGSLPWVMMSELLPFHVRSFAGSIATFANWTFATIITFAFKPYASRVTPEGAWWSFSLVMFISIFFVVLFVPETKGYMLEDVGRRYFGEGHGIFALSFRGKLHKPKMRNVRY